MTTTAALRLVCLFSAALGTVGLRADTVEVGPGDDLVEVELFGDDTLVMTGGRIETVRSYDLSTVRLHDGLAFNVFVFDNAGLGMSGGEVVNLRVGQGGFGRPIASLRGGRVMGSLAASGAVVEVFARELTRSDSALVGTWYDGSELLIRDHDADVHRWIDPRRWGSWSGVAGDADAWDTDNWFCEVIWGSYPDDDSDILLEGGEGSTTIDFSRFPGRRFELNSLLIGDGIEPTSWSFVARDGITAWYFSTATFEVRRFATLRFESIAIDQLTLPPGSTLQAGPGGHVVADRLRIAGDLEVDAPPEDRDSFAIAAYRSRAGEFDSVTGLLPGWSIEYDHPVESPDDDYLAVIAIPPATCGDHAPFRRGDANADGGIDVSDAVTILGSLFLGSPPRLSCEKAADTNDTGDVNLTDAVYLLIYLFLGSAEPAAPFDACDWDPTPDALSCDSFAPCEC